MTKKITKFDLNNIGYSVINIDLLSPDVRLVFLRRKKSMEMRISGKKAKEIFSVTGINPSEQTRLYKRFIQVEPDGMFVGEVALLPYRHITGYSRNNLSFEKRTQQKGGLSGILDLTLKIHPDVHDVFCKIVLRQGSKMYDGLKHDYKFLYAQFLNLLREYGVSESEWPFNIKSGGRVTISKYIHDIMEGNFIAASLTLGHKGKTHARLGSGKTALIQRALPFDVVQIDAYKMDGFFVLNIEPEESVFVTRTIDRFWLLVAVESKCDALLATKFVFGSEVTSQDVVDVISDAFMGDWEPMKDLTVPGLAYIKNSGMPGYIIPEAKEIVWGALYLDNAMSHHANIVINETRNHIGFAINHGQLGHPERREAVERFFKKLSMSILHRLPSSTGSNPLNGRSDAPEENAEKYNIYINEAEQLLDVWAASYNATPNGGANYGLSPLELMQQFMNSENYIFPRVKSGELSHLVLNSRSTVCTVRGSIESGTRPYLQLDNARYTNELLSQSSGLIGKKIIVKVNPKDYRSVEAYYPDGNKLGVLYVLGHWSEIKHSISTRKLINKGIANKTFEYIAGDNLVNSFLKNLESRASKKNNLIYQRVTSEINKSESTLEGCGTASTPASMRDDLKGENTQQQDGCTQFKNIFSFISQVESGEVDDE